MKTNADIVTEKREGIAVIITLLMISTYILLFFIGTILYFAWEDQSEKVCCIDHNVVINCITVLYEQYSTVMRLIGHIQHCYALN